MDQPIRTVMKKNPLSTTAQTMATDALQLMKEKGVNQLLVLEGQNLVGVLALRDLVQAGIN